jgi:hypothetical protein
VFAERVIAQTVQQRLPGQLLAWVRRTLGVPLEVWGLGLAVAAALLLTVLPALRATQSAVPEPAALDVRPFPTKTEAAPPGTAGAVDEGQLGARETNHHQLPRVGVGRGVAGGEGEAPPAVEEVAPVDQAPPPPPQPADAVLPTYDNTQRWVVATDDPAAKRELLALLAKWGGGRVTDAYGNDVQTKTRLSGQEDFVVAIDEKDLNVFQDDLERSRLGAAITGSPAASPDALIDGHGRIWIVVSLEWTRDEQGTAAP